MTPANFESWAAHQADAGGVRRRRGAGAGRLRTGTATDALRSDVTTTAPPRTGEATAAKPATGPRSRRRRCRSIGHDMTAMNAARRPRRPAGFIAFPREKMPAFAVPEHADSRRSSFNDALKGDRGARSTAAVVGPGRAASAATPSPATRSCMGDDRPEPDARRQPHHDRRRLYPNDAKHLVALDQERALDEARRASCRRSARASTTRSSRRSLSQGLSDEQIADIVAYLQALK